MTLKTSIRHADFKHAFLLTENKMFVNGITVVLCGDAESFEGASIAWATNVEKNHVMVSLPAGAAVTRAIAARQTFTVSVLGAGQSNIARQYGGSQQLRQVARNDEDLNFEQWETPIVQNSRGSFLCEVAKTISLNKQTIVLGKITDSIFSEEIPPLIYDHSAYFGI
jgi:flavin reductase (DIM6/NTAB) family NADH-FMN oxidoreductase RutF